MYATYLPIRMASQRTNHMRWTGTCNVTSLAMALSHTLPSNCAVTADGLFALLAATFQNEKLLSNVRETATVTMVKSGLLRSGEVENPHDLEGVVKTTELVKPSPGYMKDLFPRLGAEEAYEAADGGPKGRIKFRVTNEQLYKNTWYKVKVNRAKGKPPVQVSGGFLESKGKWDGTPEIETAKLSREFQRVPLGVMRINTSAESLREVGMIVAGMASVHGTVTITTEEAGKPILKLGQQTYPLAQGEVDPSFVETLLAYRDKGKRWVKYGSSAKGDDLLERIRSNTIAKKVAVVSGKFTHGGHIIVVCGYVEEDGKITGVVVADPWGKGSYEGKDEAGARDYSDHKSDALCVYEAQGFLKAYKYTAAEFISLSGGVSVKRGSVGGMSVGTASVYVVAAIG